MSMRILFLTPLLLLVLTPLSAQISDWERVLELDSLGKHTQAMKILDRLVEEPDFRYKALMMRSGIQYEDLHQPEPAFADIAKAMQHSPDSIAPYLNRGSMYMEMRMTDRAVEDLRNGLGHARTANDSASMMLNLGSALSMMRRFDEALEALDMAIGLKDDNWPAMMNKAGILDEVGRADEAYTMLLKLHEARPDDAIILNNLGFNSSSRADHTDAMRWFSKALELKPEDAVILNNLGYAQFQAGEIGPALRNVEHSIKLYPGNSYAYRNLGLILQAKGEQAKACTAFEDALSRGFTKQYGPEVDDMRRKNCH